MIIISFRTYYVTILISHSKIALVSQPYLTIMIFLKFYCGTETMAEYSTKKVYKSATLDNVNAILKLKMKRYASLLCGILEARIKRLCMQQKC